MKIKVAHFLRHGVDYLLHWLKLCSHRPSKNKGWVHNHTLRHSKGINKGHGMV